MGHEHPGRDDHDEHQHRGPEPRRAPARTAGHQPDRGPRDREHRQLQRHARRPADRLATGSASACARDSTQIRTELHQVPRLLHVPPLPITRVGLIDGGGKSQEPGVDQLAGTATTARRSSPRRVTSRAQRGDQGQAPRRRPGRHHGGPPHQREVMASRVEAGLPPPARARAALSAGRRARMEKGRGEDQDAARQKATVCAHCPDVHRRQAPRATCTKKHARARGTPRARAPAWRASQNQAGRRPSRR